MSVWRWILIFAALLGVCSRSLEAKEPPKLVKGVLDIRGWDFEKDGSIPLEGEAEFYWDRFMDPDSSKWNGTIKPVYIDVQGGWQKFGFPVYGKATYRFRIESDRPVKLATKLLWGFTNIKLYVNGTLSSQSERTEDGRLLYPFSPPRLLTEQPHQSYEMVFYSENQDFFLGGAVSINEIGDLDVITKSYLKRWIMNAGILFAFLTLALYNIGLFAVNRRDWAPLLIAGLCLCVCGLLASTTGMADVIVPPPDRFFYLGLYNVTFYCSVPMIWFYMKSVFPNVWHGRLAILTTAFSVLAMAVLFSTPPRFYLKVSKLYEIIIMLTYIYMIVLAIRATYRKELGARVFLFGLFVTIAFSVTETLVAHGLVPNFPAAAIGMFFFCFCQSLILSMRFAETLRQVQHSEVEIRHLNENLREKEKARTLFFHNTSHELRTPLNGIIGFVDLIEQERYGAITDATRQQLSKVKSLAISLKQQVNTILDLAKSKQGKLTLRNIQFPLDHLLTDSQNLAEGLNLKKPQVKFQIEKLGFDAQTLWIHDYEKVYTIIRNLIGNAFKFTAIDKPSQVHLVLHLLPDQSLQMTVRDTGIGIPASHKDKIFQEFQQVESDARRSYEGTGLGLAMVRDLVNLMGGTVTVESEEGKGSMFTVIIPAQTVIHAEKIDGVGEWSKSARQTPSKGSLAVSTLKSADAEPGATHLILVVDDNEMNCEVVRDILTLEGYEVILAFGGQDALLKLREHHPDLVLLDLMMPEVSGEDVLQAMKADPELDNIPVILLTARATEEDRIHGLELGADDYLAKPLIARELILRVHNLLLRIESTRLLEGVEHREKMALMGELLSDLSHELKNIHHTDAYNSQNLIEYVQPILNLFPQLNDHGLTAEALLNPAANIDETQAKEQKLLAGIHGKADRQDRRLAMYLASLPLAMDRSLSLWAWARGLPMELRLAFENLLAMLQHVNALSQSSERTQELITAVLDYGRYHRAQSAVDISRVVASSLLFLQARFRRAGIKVENHVQALEVLASSSDLQQIALNILSNAYDAIKELGSEQDRIVTITGEEDHQNKLIRLKFMNKGPGIPEDVLPHIFERRFTTKGDKGSGLGLYVSRRLAVKNHGDLQAACHDGQTAFELTLRKAG